MSPKSWDIGHVLWVISQFELLSFVRDQIFMIICRCVQYYLVDTTRLFYLFTQRTIQIWQLIYIRQIYHNYNWWSSLFSHSWKSGVASCISPMLLNYAHSEHSEAMCYWLSICAYIWYAHLLCPALMRFSVTHLFSRKVNTWCHSSYQRNISYISIAWTKVDWFEHVIAYRN